MSKKEGSSKGCLIVLVVVVAGGYFAYQTLPGPILTALAVAVFVVFAIISLVVSNSAKKERFEEFCAPIKEHAATLARRRRQLVTQDAYGKDVLDKWFMEMEHFRTQVIEPTVDKKSIEFFNELTPSILNAIEQIATTYEGPTLTQAPSTTKDIGDTLEIACEDKLKAMGWTVRRVGGSGDQGVDLVAEKNTLRVAVQCKNYSTPVGNAAVQEVLAGKIFEEADYAVVVTSSSYTPAAVQLAQKSGVALLHTTDLDDFDRLVLEKG